MPATPSHVEKLRNHSAHAAALPSTSAIWPCTVGVIAEKRCAQLGFGDRALVGGVLEFGELVHHGGQFGLVAGPDAADEFGHVSTPSADKIVLNFVVVSATSSSGSDSATMPPPAWAYGGAAVGGQLRAADGHHPAAVATLVAPADRARVEAAVALQFVDQLGRRRRSGTPPTAGVGCSATARSSAVVEFSRSRPVIGRVEVPHRRGAAELRSGRDLQVDAQRFERLAHRVDDELVLVPVLGRLGQRRAAGLVGGGVGQPRCRSPRTARRSPRRRGGPPAVRGWRRRARHRSNRRPPPSDRRDRRWRRVVCGEAVQDGPRVQRAVGDQPQRAGQHHLVQAVAGIAQACSASAMRARCTSGGGQHLGDPHRRQRHATASRAARRGTGPSAAASAPPAWTCQRARRPT